MLDDVLTSIPAWPYLAAAGAALVAACVLLAVLLRKKGRSKLARRVTALATVLGMAWSAQGMWDVTVNHLEQPVVVASVLFAVFESMMVARMLKAHEYRTDFTRRARHVHAVWLIACVMAAVVALGEGWREAPLRISIPLLVAYGWYVDLTSDDDPGEKPKTSLRWTFRRAGLAIGMLEATARDAQTIDRDRLRNRITRLAFRIEHGDKRINGLLNRTTRLARLKTIADDADIAEVRARLARSTVDLYPASPGKPKPPPVTETKTPSPRLILPASRPQGMHERAGRALRGADLKADALAAMRESMTPARPRGYTAAELAALYTPPLGSRTAEGIAAAARKPVNGNVPDLTPR